MSDTRILHDRRDVPCSRLIALLPPAVATWFQARPLVSFLLAVGFVLVTFVVVDRKVLAIARLSEDQYTEPLLLPGLLARAGVGPTVALLIVLVVLCWQGSLLGAWDRLSASRALRGFVVLLAALLAWPLVTQGYNPYLGQSHDLDALLAVVLVVALWWRPGFIVILVPVLAMLLGRVATPTLGGSILAHKLQVFHLLSLFAAAMLLHTLTGRPIARVYAFLALCMVAGSYFIAAVAKIELSWWEFPHLHLLPASSFGHGWLHDLQPEAIGTLVHLLEPLALPLQLVVLTLEAACLLMLVGRIVTIAQLSVLIVFHFGVLALYGFFFWTWILVDAALIALILRLPYPLGHGRERLALVSVSVVLIASATVWARPAQLGWFDTGLTYTYRFEGVGRSGRHYALHPAYFAPYTDVFTMTPFHYLSDSHRVLTGSYGVTRRLDVARAIAGATTAGEILALEKAMGEDRHHETRARRLEAFVRRFVERKNVLETGSGVAKALAPPGQFISLGPGVRAVPGDPLESVRVVEVTTFFDGTRPQTARRMDVLTIHVGADWTRSSGFVNALRAEASQSGSVGDGGPGAPQEVR